MSWDLFAMKLPRAAHSIDQVGESYEPPAIGPRSEVIAAIATAIPEADFSDPSWGFIETPQASIEVNLGSADIVESFALHVRGGGAEMLALIARLLASVDVRAIDGSTGDFFVPGDSSPSWAEWQRYRDRVIGDDPSSE